MRRTILSGVAVLALVGPALAQTTTIQPAPAPGASATVTLAPEQRTRIKQYVVQQKVKPATIRERVTVGATLPADVELATVPADWGPDLGRYRYFYAQDNVYLVEPSSRRIVHVID